MHPSSPPRILTRQVASLTPAQQRVLDALRDLTQDGWPTTVREVGAELGFGSPSTAHHHLLNLQDLGYAKQHPRRPAGGWLPTDTHAA